MGSKDLLLFEMIALAGGLMPYPKNRESFLRRCGYPGCKNSRQGKASFCDDCEKFLKGRREESILSR